MEPIPSNEDSRIGVVRPMAGQQIRLRAAPGQDLTVLLAPGEHALQVVSSDPAVWHVAVSAGQDALVLSALRVAAASRLSVRTDRGDYDIQLTAALDYAGPYLVRFETTGSGARGQPKVWTPPVISLPGTYKLSGQKELLPKSIRDDGRKIYVEWAASQAIPAVFALDRLGREEMVDGYMRDGVFTLDRLYDELVFRIDKAEAHAKRVAQKVKK